MKPIKSEDFARALADAGIVPDLDSVMEIYISIRPGQLVQIDCQLMGDERLLTLAGELTDE